VFRHACLLGAEGTLTGWAAGAAVEADNGTGRGFGDYLNVNVHHLGGHEMKATVKRKGGHGSRLKSVKEVRRDVTKSAKATVKGAGRKLRSTKSKLVGR
jgi:hypothetical protein